MSESILSFDRIGDLATDALLLELRTWPKPGLVSHLDSGGHADMDAGTLRVSAEALRPFFAALAEAGAAEAGLDHLREIGKAAEQAMLLATQGVNTHRGAIFGLGLLCAAAGALLTPTGRSLPGASLGVFVRQRWGNGILSERAPGQSHGAVAWQRHGAGGARAEAAAGFPNVYHVGSPALQRGMIMAPGDENAARVQACFALIAELEDTNLLHRGGQTGLRFAQQAARGFLVNGGVGQDDWRRRAAAIHREFVARRLSPGGSADLLAATLLVSALETQKDAVKTDTPCYRSF